jgi:hypothetical protein
MKISPYLALAKLLAILLTVVAILTGSIAHAQILLQIDDSTPSSTVITATTNLLTVSDVPAYSIYAGFDLLGLFTADAGGDNLSFDGSPSTLTTGNGSSALIFDQAAPDEPLGTYNMHYNLGLYNNDDGPGGAGTGGNTISFTHGDAAFTGSLTLNLSGTTLTTATSGSIVAGSSAGGNPDTVIGEWEIIGPVEAPEPSTWVLLVGSIGLLPLLRRFRRA